MPGFELLDVAIRLVFLYLLLSLFCSAITEPGRVFFAQAWDEPA